MALKELLKQRVMEKLNFSQEISDEHLKGVIQEEIMKISEEYPLLLSDKIDEIKTICHYCSRKATMVLRMEDGKPVYEGAQVQIGGHESYISVCRKHWFNPPQENIIPLNKA